MCLGRRHPFQASLFRTTIVPPRARRPSMHACRLWRGCSASPRLHAITTRRTTAIVRWVSRLISRSSFLGLSLPSKAVALCTIYSTLMLRPAYSSSNTTPLLLLHNLTDSTARGRWHGRTSASAGAYLAIRSCARAHAYPRLPRESSFRKWTELAWPWHNTSVVSRRELELVVGRLGR